MFSLLALLNRQRVARLTQLVMAEPGRTVFPKSWAWTPFLTRGFLSTESSRGQDCAWCCRLLRRQSFRQKKMGREQPALRCGPRKSCLRTGGWRGREGTGTLGPPGLPLMAVSSLAAGRCAELQAHVTEAMAMVTEQRELIARLEQDLSTIQSIQRPDAEVSPL